MIDVAEIQPAGVDRFPVWKPRPPANADALSREILALKQKLNAVILAHNYQVPEIQDVADFVGDSLGLSQQAAKTNAEVIVFCGVHFMAETAKILNPHKVVVLPDKDAGCSLEESCPADQLRAFQATNPNFYTIAYINCSADVKALSDVICTSGNAVKIVVHPESLREVRNVADAVCSTEKMIDYCRTNPARRFVVVTESGIIHRLHKECPGKEFLCAPVFDVMKMPTDNCRCSECRYMKMNTLEKLRDCMKNLAPRVELPEEIIRRARLPIERMLEISAGPLENAG